MKKGTVNSIDGDGSGPYRGQRIKETGNTPMTLLSNLPPKVKAKIQKYLMQFRFKFAEGFIYFEYYDSDGDYCEKELPEPAVIGLLTAWLESEGWEWQKRTEWLMIHTSTYKHNGLQIGDTFWQAFEKVTKIMEEQE